MWLDQVSLHGGRGARLNNAVLVMGRGDKGWCPSDLGGVGCHPPPQSQVGTHSSHTPCSPQRCDLGPASVPTSTQANPRASPSGHSMGIPLTHIPARELRNPALEL